MKVKKVRKLITSDSIKRTGHPKKTPVKKINYEKELEIFKPGIVIKEARNFRHLTQEALAIKSGTTKYYISRIENDGSDIRLSTLMKIVEDGLRGKLKILCIFDK